MIDFEKRIKALEEKLKRLDNLLNITEQEINNLETESKLDKSKIKNKERELEEWRKKLEECQQEKIKMEQELKAQISQLEKSEIPIAEKQKQTNGLLNGKKQALDNLEQRLYEERTHYRQIRDKLINRLLEPCQICEAKEQLIIVLNDRINKISIWTFLIFLSSIFHFFMFLYMVFKRISDKKQKSHHETLKEALNKRRAKIENN